MLLDRCEAQSSPAPGCRPVHPEHEEHDGAGGAEEEAEDGQETHVVVRRLEGDVENNKGNTAVLDGRLQRDGNNLWNHTLAKRSLGRPEKLSNLLCSRLAEENNMRP